MTDTTTGNSESPGRTGSGAVDARPLGATPAPAGNLPAENPHHARRWLTSP